MEILPGVHLIDMGTASNATALEALGIEVVVLCGAGMVLPHSATIVAIHLPVDYAGRSPTWYHKAVAALWNHVYGLGGSTRVVALADRQGGLCEAVYILAGAVATRRGVTFAAALATVGALLSEPHRISSELLSQGTAAWP